MQEAQVQKTIGAEVMLRGRALFSGKDTSVVLKPAGINTGVVFVQGEGELAVSPLALCKMEIGFRCTVLGAEHLNVYPVEHLLAAFLGLGITNVTIHLESAELPFFDGSSESFVRSLLEVGIVPQPAPCRQLILSEEVRVSSGSEELYVSPSPILQIEYHLNYKNSSIGRQSFSFDFSTDNFIQQIASARTFCTEEEGQAFLKRGGQGGSFENSLIFGKHGLINNKLRFPEEPVRHKILDLLGDLALLGCDLRAKIVARGSGHALNAELVKKLVISNQPSARKVENNLKLNAEYLL